MRNSYDVTVGSQWEQRINFDTAANIGRREKKGLEKRGKMMKRPAEGSPDGTPTEKKSNTATEPSFRHALNTTSIKYSTAH